MTNLNDSRYTRKTLHICDSFEIVSCEWIKNSVSADHGHGWSQCYVLIQEGVFENTAQLGHHTEVTLKEPGQVITTPVGSRHAVKCISEGGGKTLHVYVPSMNDSANKTQVAPQTSSALKQTLDLALRNQPMNWDVLTGELQRIQSSSVSTHSPYFMNQLFSGVNPEMLLAENFIAQTKSTMATYEASPVFTLIEQEVVQNLGELAGWPKNKIEGVAVPGGSAANFMALHCARQRKFLNYKTEGLPAGTRVQIFVSEEAHYSFQKACAVLGFGTSSLVAVKADSMGRMSATDLSLKIQKCLDKKAVPLMVCATAGTTVLGAFDPIDQIAAVCKPFDIWLHVDGAWGGPVLFSKQHRSLLNGIEKADSLTFDAHKLLGANLTCSFFVTNDPKILLASNDVSGGDYLFHENSDVIDRGRMSWQCGRSADAMSFWTIWKSAGTENLGSFVDRLMRVQKEAVIWIQQQPRLKLVSDPSFLNICVQILPPAGNSSDPKTWSRVVRDRLREKNQAMINYSSNKEGLLFLRLILAHSQTDLHLIQQMLTWALEVE